VSQRIPSRTSSALALCLVTSLTACKSPAFPAPPDGYREFAYVSNGAANTVSVLDLVYLRQDRTLQVGASPSGLAASPTRNEVYVVNTQPAQSAGSISVIDTATNQVAATIAVHRLPYAISVEPTGHRAYVANAGSNTVSVLDLDHRRPAFTAAAGEQPGLARISPDGRSLVVTNRGSNSISIYAAAPFDSPDPALKLRATFAHCPGATDAVILPDSSKAFVACSAGHQVMAIALASAPNSWPAKVDPTSLTDHFLTFLNVGQTPTHLALKPDGGEIFVSNFTSDSISEISTTANEVGGTYAIGSKPSQAVVSGDNTTLWVSNFGSENLTRYSIEDGRVMGGVRAGAAPDALAFSADEHLLLAADAHSGDVAVIRTQGKLGPALLTMLPAGKSPNAIVVKSMQTKK